MGSVTDTRGRPVSLDINPATEPEPPKPRRIPFRRPGPSPIGIVAILLGILVMLGGFVTGGNLVVVGIGVIMALAGGATSATPKQKVCEHCMFPIPWDARVCGHCTREVR